MGSDSYKPLLYLSLITIVIYIVIILSLQAFEVDISEITSNGNTIITTFINVLNGIPTIINVLVGAIPIIGDDAALIITTITNPMINTFIDFLSVWYLINIYLFYLLFIPYMIAVFYSLLALIEGFIPLT